MPDLIVTWLSSYPTLFVVCVLCGLLVPFPEDIVVMTVGTLVADDVLKFGPAALITGAGMFLRDLIAFVVWRKFGLWLLGRPRVVRFFGASSLLRWRRWFARRGAFGIFLVRFAVGFRVKLFAIAATMGVRTRTFVIMDLLGMVIVAPLLVYLGFRFGDPAVESFRRIIKVCGPTTTALIAVLIVALIIWRRRVLRSRGEDDSAALEELQKSLANNDAPPTIANADPAAENAGPADL